MPHNQFPRTGQLANTYKFKKFLLTGCNTNRILFYITQLFDSRLCKQPLNIKLSNYYTQCDNYKHLWCSQACGWAHVQLQQNTVYCNLLMGKILTEMHGLIQKFDRENIDGQHLRQPVLAIALQKILKGKVLMDLQLSVNTYPVNKYSYGSYYRASKLTNKYVNL